MACIRLNASYRDCQPRPGGGGRVGRGVRAVRLGQFERERQLTPHCGSAQGDWVSDNSFQSYLGLQTDQSNVDHRLLRVQVARDGSAALSRPEGRRKAKR